jgi:hypothetical protein
VQEGQSVSDSELRRDKHSAGREYVYCVACCPPVLQSCADIFARAEFSDAIDLNWFEINACMLIARLGAERSVDSSSRILDVIKLSAGAEYIAFAFCLPLLLLA